MPPFLRRSCLTPCRSRPPSWSPARVRLLSSPAATTAAVAFLLPRCPPVLPKTLPSLRATPRFLLSRSFHTSRCARDLAATPEYTVAIVGSGPGGFYTAQKLLKDLPDVRIDVYEALPVPFGLIRFGVAPDHPEVKNVVHKFDALAQDPRLRLICNVRIDTDLTVDELRSSYDAVILAYGASADKELGVANERNMPNVLSARAFVGWYNALPEYKDLDPDLESSDTAVVIGQGNVALDVARVLLAPLEDLAKTDIAEHALEKLRGSKIRHVYLLGRRGPLQISFTAKELREMLVMPGLKLEIDPSVITNEVAAASDYPPNRARTRLMDLVLQAASATPSVPPTRTWSLLFNASPTELLSDPSDPSRLVGLRYEKTRLEGPPDAARAVPTGEFAVIPCGLLLRSIGYKSLPISGVPFDSKRNVVPNKKGKVLDDEGEPIPGLYASGWVKRGPVGVIATSMYDASETATSILSDIRCGDLGPGGESGTRGYAVMSQLLRERGVEPVLYEDWLAIDSAERKLGELRGKPREKLASLEEMLEVVRKGRSER
ncbi:NADPH:adrenodoxin oxidoreductase [Blyttiomyces helicus]|uniref:NADPH:adrenodoxin oxidoreductase, mitochondrial n=1 Tax=Blyttiomyces helicus TaxID=388810 RepID=A0A4P9W036_9FUNG|nr:NADPH:adrenodoxin oxidoreductase [Blyttiomyces helicus]|eukprot:RKO85424.1 NADPH:adrenodoxin oxidoreductase [Blyttiomyces helicus]